MNILHPLYTGTAASVGLPPAALAFYQALERRNTKECLERIHDVEASNPNHSMMLRAILTVVAVYRLERRLDFEPFIAALPIPSDAPAIMKAHAELILSDLHRSAGSRDEAVYHAEVSLRLFVEEQRSFEQALLHYRLGILMLESGNDYLHNSYMLQAVELLGQFPNHPFYPKVVAIAAAAILGNRASDALDLIMRAIESARDNHDVETQFALVQSVVLAHKKSGRYDLAESHMDELMQLAMQTEKPECIARSVLSKLDCLLKRNDPLAAELLTDHLEELVSKSDIGTQLTYLSAQWQVSLRARDRSESDKKFRELHAHIKNNKRADWLIVALKERLEYQGHQLTDSERAETYRELAELIETRYDAQTATLPALYTSYKRQLDARHELQRIQHQEQVAMSIQVRDMVIDEIAQVLHDDLGQRIATTRLHAERLARQFQGHADQAQAYNDVSIGLVEIGDSVRKLSQTLSTKSVSDLGLFKAFHLMTDSIAAGGTVTVFAHTIGPEESIPFTIARTTYRIAQSLLQNALKHSRCSSIEAQIIVSDGVLQLTVGDDGTGFDPDAPRSVTGLRDVEMRVSSADGTMTIDTAPGRGTFVTISIPLEKT